MEKSNFEKLFAINVNTKTEKKKTGNTQLTYLSWAWAWAEFVKVHPDAMYEIIKNDNGVPYFHDESGAMVYTKVTAGGITHEMWLPVMDGANNAMKSTPYIYQVKEYNYGKPTGKMIDKSVSAYTMFDINKTIMRCLTKNLAMFGLGLYIYAGEDLPEDEKPEMLPPPSKADSSEKMQAWKHFQALCEQQGVDASEFLESQVDMTDKNAVYGVVRKWLANEQQLRDQLIIFRQS